MPGDAQFAANLGFALGAMALIYNITVLVVFGRK